MALLERDRGLTWDDVSYHCSLLEAESNSVLRFGPAAAHVPWTEELQAALQIVEADVARSIAANVTEERLRAAFLDSALGERSV